MKRFFLRLVHVILFLSMTQFFYAQQRNNLEISCQYKILKEKKLKNKFRDIRTTGVFRICLVELKNTDNIPHTIDYSCFYLIDNNNVKYDIHFDATLTKQGEFEDWHARMDSDTFGFNTKIIKPNHSILGWLVFEIPAEGEYQLKFRGYIN